MSFTDARTVMRFAEVMFMKLGINSWKGHWSSQSTKWLLNRLRQETRELKRVLEDEDSTAEEIRGECADVANFAMMIADNAERERTADPADDGGRG